LKQEELQEVSSEPILKEVAPELFEEEKPVEPSPDDVTEEQFEKMLDARPTAEKQPEPEPEPIPETLIDTDQPFYIDHRNVLVIKKYAEMIIPNLPSITEYVLSKKGLVSIADFDRTAVKVNAIEEEDYIVITHVTYVDKYEVTFRVVLKDVYDYLSIIDFDEL